MNIYISQNVLCQILVYNLVQEQDLDRRVSAFSFYFTRDVGMLTIYILLFPSYYCFVKGSILPQ